MVAQNTVHTYEYFDLLKAFGYIDRIIKSDFLLQLADIWGSNYLRYSKNVSFKIDFIFFTLREIIRSRR